jgi:hypothetical protein
VDLGGSVIEWDGRGSRGQIVDAGIYQIVVFDERDRTGAVQIQPVQVQRPPNPARGDVLLYPNPLDGGGRVYFEAVGGFTGNALEIKIFSLSGEKVVQLGGPGPRVVWELGKDRPASGVYLAAVTVHTASGPWLQIKKLALVH